LVSVRRGAEEEDDDDEPKLGLDYSKGEQQKKNIKRCMKQWDLNN